MPTGGFSASSSDQSTKSLETALNAKAGIQWGSSFAVGSGSSASSSPSLSGDNAGIPTSYVLIGAGVAVLAVLLIALRK
ncbi:MAG: hypothetical protein H7343_10225 [Undibacterium sp.]|nr:hypothetical protein [Opitutaceae bacterium]